MVGGAIRRKGGALVFGQRGRDESGRGRGLLEGLNTAFYEHANTHDTSVFSSALDSMDGYPEPHP